MIENEFWKDVKGYEGQYQVSNLGRVKGLARLDFRGWRIKEKIFKLSIASNGYYTVCLTKANKQKTHFVHQLVAVAFLGHTKCNYEAVINHIDFDRLNNRVDNLEVTTQRANTNKKHKPSASKYTGVVWDRNRWAAQIWVTDRNVRLGRSTYEYDAHLAYEAALIEVMGFDLL